MVRASVINGPAYFFYNSAQEAETIKFTNGIEPGTPGGFAAGSGLVIDFFRDR